MRGEERANITAHPMWPECDDSKAAWGQPREAPSDGHGPDQGHTSLSAEGRPFGRSHRGDGTRIRIILA